MKITLSYLQVKFKQYEKIQSFILLGTSNIIIIRWLRFYISLIIYLAIDRIMAIIENIILLRLSIS